MWCVTYASNSLEEDVNTVYSVDCVYIWFVCVQKAMCESHFSTDCRAINSTIFHHYHLTEIRISFNGQMPGCTLLFFNFIFFKCLLYFFVATWADQDYISGSECVKRKVCCALSCLPMLVTLHFICVYASVCHKVRMLQTFWWQFSVLRITVGGKKPDIFTASRHYL